MSVSPIRRAPPLSTDAVAAPRASESRGSIKGQQTKAAIIDAALRLASQVGLEGLSIGAVAEIMRMSKSGVFAHFGAREELQISVVREYFHRFEGAYQALWWVPAGHRPSIDEGLSRLWMLDRYGPSPQAFTFKARFPKPGEGTPPIDMKPDPWCIGNA